MDAGASVDNLRWSGETPLHILANSCVVNVLFEDIEFVSHDDTEESLDCLDNLLERNPSVNELDGHECDLGKTAFHIATIEKM